VYTFSLFLLFFRLSSSLCGLILSSLWRHHWCLLFQRQHLHLLQHLPQNRFQYHKALKQIPSQVWFPV
jgi:hypothetical protein